LDPSQAWSWPWYQAHPVAREGYKENTPNQTKKKVNKNKANNGQLQPLRLQTMGKYISCWNCRAWYSAREIQDTRQETDLSKKNMPNSWINILFNRLARGYHVPILEFHGFGTLCPKLSTHNNLCCYVSESKFQITATMPKKKKTRNQNLEAYLTSFCPTLHYKPQHSITSPVKVTKIWPQTQFPKGTKCTHADSVYLI
jgi:hypothetical protein